MHKPRSDSFERSPDCGTFIVCVQFFETVLLGSLQIEPEPIRSLGTNGSWHYGGYYSLRKRSQGGIGIDFSAGCRPMLGSSGLNFGVTSGGLISYLSYADELSFEVHLLLGPTDDLIRFLLLSKDQRPLETRTIRLTFSELRARLIHEWKCEYNEPVGVETMEVHPDAAAARS